MVSGGDWLYKVADIKDQNNAGAVYVGNSLTVHKENLLV